MDEKPKNAFRHKKRDRYERLLTDGSGRRENPYQFIEETSPTDIFVTLFSIPQIYEGFDNNEPIYFEYGGETLFFIITDLFQSNQKNDFNAELTPANRKGNRFIHNYYYSSRSPFGEVIGTQIDLFYTEKKKVDIIVDFWHEFNQALKAIEELEANRHGNKIVLEHRFTGNGKLSDPYQENGGEEARLSINYILKSRIIRYHLQTKKSMFFRIQNATFIFSRLTDVQLRKALDQKELNSSYGFKTQALLYHSFEVLRGETGEKVNYLISFPTPTLDVDQSNKLLANLNMNVDSETIDNLTSMMAINSKFIRV